MSYIGNADPKLLFADNVRDDLIPNPPQTLFDLSQEVPGGYEGNVFVFRRKHFFKEVIAGTSELTFDNATTTIECNDSITSALLRANLREGYFIRISGATEAQNNSIFEIVTLSYNDPNIVLTLNNPIIDESGGSITIEISADGFWEVLEPEVDYIITGVGPNLNKQIQLSEVLNEEDVCYVVHKGSATYNFVPSAKSVGPDQLQENLRNFFVDRFEGDGSETVFELSEEPVNTKSIIVTVDGVFLDGDDVMEFPPFEGDWFLDSDPASGDPRPTPTNGRFLTFTNPPANGAQIRVLHLSFSTISRRASLSDGQVGAVPPNSIGTNELANSSVTNSKLALNSVSTSNIQNNAVTGAKILLQNNESLKALLNDNTTQFNILRLSNFNRTVLNASNEIYLSIDNVPTISIEDQKVVPAKLGVDLGSNAPLGRFQEFFVQDIDMTGDINGININTLQTLVNTLQSQINQLNNGRSSYDGLLPPGVFVPFASNTVPPGWLLCNGQSVPVATYPDLFAVIGYTWGGAGPNFNVPDFRQRFVLGKGDSGEGSTLNSSGGPGVTGNSPSIGHNHSFSHSHNVSVSGNVPAHNHSLIGGTVSIIDTGHSHTMNPHNHSMDHRHYIDPHFHDISGNFNIRIPGAYGVGASVSSGVPVSYQDGASPLSPRFAFAHFGVPANAITFDTILSGSLIDNSKTQTRRWFPRTDGPAESNSARAGTGSQNGSANIDIVGNGMRTNHPVGPSSPGTSAVIPTGNSTSTMQPSNSNIQFSGNTANSSLVSMTSTGNTTSQSSINTSDNSPPWRAANYIIKV